MRTIANPWHHAISSVRKWGGVPEDYLEVHTWFDLSKEHLSDFRHRALRHHTQGIFEAERVFGPTISVTIGYEVDGEKFDSKVAAAFRARDVYGEPPTAAFEKYVMPIKKEIPTRWIGEQHVEEDLGRIPTLADWLSCIAPQPWMNRSRRLSQELEQEEART